MKHLIAAVIIGIITSAMTCKTSGNPFAYQGSHHAST